MLLAGLSVPSFAQTSPPSQDPPIRDQAYFRDLVSLSGVIGSAHAVRLRCNGVSDQYWRSYMVQTLGLEAPVQGPLRSGMVAAFNRGFERENANSVVCDASANEREARYAVQGQEIAARLAAFYFPEKTNP